MSRRINSLEINNFRQYHDVGLDFCIKNTTSDLNIVLGNNRFGKTNLLNSLLWALYGENITDNGDKIVNVKNERYANDDVAVKIKFQNTEDIHDNDIFQRTASNGLSLLKKDKVSNKYIPSDNSRADVENILSKSVANLFLFKGEYLETFFEAQNRQLLKETVQKVSNLDKLNNICVILDDLVKKYRKQITKINNSDTKLRKLEEKINDLEDKTKDIQNHIDANEGEKKKYGYRLDEIKKSLLGLNETQINFLLSEEDRLKAQEAELISQINEFKKNSLNLFVDDISFWFLHDGIKEFKKELNDMENRGLLPPPVNPQTIMKIFEEKKCICGNELNEEMRSVLDALLQSVTTNKSNLETLYKINLGLYAEKENFKKLSSKLETHVTQISKCEGKLEDVRRSLGNISEDLKSINEEDITALQVEKESLEEAIEQLDANTSQYRSILFNYESDLEEKKRDFAKKSSRVSGTELLTKKLNFAVNLKEETIQIYSEILEEIRRDLNKKTKDSFKELFWNNYKYINYEIRLNKDFELEVLSPKSNNMINELSTGEQKVLALSFMTALSDFYGFDFPLVIDAPFTALQKEVTINVLKTLIDISKKKQVIIFTIPQEEDIMKELSENANVIYELEKDVEDNTIVELVR